MRPLVLYVEDDRDNMKLVRRVLNASGITLLEATTAAEGIAMAEEHRPDIILMDINMPVMDGLAATRLLRSKPEFKQTPIVALTANVMHDVLEKALAAGCNGYIGKPIAIDTLLDDIMKYLDS